MDGIDWLVANALWFCVIILIGLACLGYGYYVASKDLDEERAKAWARGRSDAAKASRDADAAHNIVRVPNPYLKTPGALPPVHRTDSPV